MRSLETPVLSHWHKLVDGFEASPLEYYAAVEEAVRAREIPEAHISRVEYREGGIFSAARLYLRVRHRRLAFDICGAPYGRGFFFSSWLVETKPEVRAWGCLVLLVAFGLTAFVFEKFGFKGCFITLLILIGTVWAVLQGVRDNWFLSEDAILALPYLGPLYEHFFAPDTYYKIDTMLMFQATVHGAMLEVIDSLLEGKGLRALAPEDRKPTMRSLVR